MTWIFLLVNLSVCKWYIALVLLQLNLNSTGTERWGRCGRGYAGGSMDWWVNLLIHMHWL